MSRLTFTLVSDEVTMVAATAKTVLRLDAPANHRVALKGVGVYFKGITSSNEPVTVELLRCTTAGTMTSKTPKRLQPGAETIQSTGAQDASAEPTMESGQPLRRWTVHPQGGHVEKWGPDDEIVLAGSERAALRITADDGVVVIGELYAEE